jgi:HlyD family secretion protein
VQQLEVEVTQRQAKIAELQNLLLTAQTKLKDRFLYAPINGTILSLNIANIGEVVQPGQTIAEMASDKAPLVLAAYLPNREVGLVKPGMPVQVKLDAFPYQDYGIIPGRVVSISPNAKSDERLGPIYQVEISLNHHSVTNRQQTIPFKPGQTATADIVIRRRRIAELVLDPLKKLQKGGIGL